MDDLDECQRLLRIGTRLLFQELGDPWGHIAVRLPESAGRPGFILKHVRAASAPADPESTMTFDYDGNLIEGTRRIPWELPLYTAIFKARPDAMSVVHTHPLVATALTMADKTVFAITVGSAMFEHGVPVFPGDMINSNELGAALANTLGAWPAALLKGHGAVTVGPSLPMAVQTTLNLELGARQQLWAATLGTPAMLEERLIAFHRNAPPGDGDTALWDSKLYYGGLDAPHPQ
jgi:ribulose-5-phosphate 4-epimerase/fuculose-1-phosphate aldolase